MNFIELLQELNISFWEEGNHHCRPGWVQMDCPFCGDAPGTGHLGLNKTHGYFNCWRCGPHNLYTTLSTLSKVSSKELFVLLKDIDRGGKGKEVERVKSGKLVIPKSVGELLPAHKQYLKKRRYDPAEVVELWGVKGIGVSSKLSWRLWLPISLNYETVSWTTRTIGTGTRYISASPSQEAIAHKTLLYGEDYASNAIIIVEGPISAWRIGPGAVATFGLNVSTEQTYRMACYPVRVICFDNSNEAQKRAKRLANLLALFPGETYQVCMSGEDPDLAPHSEIKRLRKQFLQ